MSFSMTGAFKEIQATPVQRLVAYMLADAHNQLTGRCDLSVASLVRLTSLSERAVRGALTELEKAGHLTRVFRRGTSTQYRLHPRKNGDSTSAVHAPRSKHPSAAVAPTLRNSRTPPLHGLHLTPAPGAPKSEGTRNELTMNLCRLTATGEVFLEEKVSKGVETSTPPGQSSSLAGDPRYAEFPGMTEEVGDGNDGTSGLCNGNHESPAFSLPASAGSPMAMSAILPEAAYGNISQSGPVGQGDVFRRPLKRIPQSGRNSSCHSGRCQACWAGNPIA